MSEHAKTQVVKAVAVMAPEKSCSQYPGDSRPQAIIDASHPHRIAELGYR